MRYWYQCPRCKQDAVFLPVQENDTGTGCLILLVGGLLASALYSDRQARRVQCGDCDYIFARPGLPWSGLAALFLILMTLAVVAALFVAVTSNVPEFEQALPESQWLVPFEQLVENHPRTIVYAFGAFLGAVFLLSLIGMEFANRSLRKRIDETHLTQPMSRELAETVRAKRTPEGPL